MSLDQVVQQLRTQWGGSFEGTTLSWGGTRDIFYSIPLVTPFDSESEENAHFIENLSPLMQDRARLAFELWDDLIARDITEAGKTAFSQIQFAYADKTFGSANKLVDGGGTYTAPWDEKGGTNEYGTKNYDSTRQEIWLNNDWTDHDEDADIFWGSYGFQTYLHEIGHALGLSHPGSYNEDGSRLTYAKDAEYAEDTLAYTTMSYFDANDDKSGTDHKGADGELYYSATPLLHDIAAIQAIYGADMTTRTGDTTYGFGSTADREVYDFTQNPNPIVAIWDAGGIDTIDVSDYRTNQVVNLIDGTFSNVGSMTNNLAIAFDTVIEYAVGGSGNDSIIGNEAANALTGGPGKDKIYGGIGGDDLFGESKADIFVFQLPEETTVAASGRDTIYDFSLSGGDKVSLSVIDADSGVGGDQGFEWAGTKAFSGDGGELRFVKQKSDTYIYGDINGDRKADFAIHFDDALNFAIGDFAL